MSEGVPATWVKDEECARCRLVAAIIDNDSTVEFMRVGFFRRRDETKAEFQTTMSCNEPRGDTSASKNP